jgi:hypothetical protein
VLLDTFRSLGLETHIIDSRERSRESPHLKSRFFVSEQVIGLEIVSLADGLRHLPGNWTADPC